MKIRIIMGAVALASVGFVAPAMADSHEEAMKAFMAEKVAPWLGDAEVVDAIKAQNAAHASFDQAKVDEMDKQWRAEVDASSKPMVDGVLANDLSKYLAAKRDEAGGVITEIFVMDNKGMNVGQSDMTSDYWQGDEDKWTATFKGGPDAVFVDEIEKDESTQMLQSQASVAVKDPASGEVIGAITVGVDVEGI